MSTLGVVAIVLVLAQVHARVIAHPRYSFTGTSRFGWVLALLGLLTLTTYAVGLPDQPRSVAQATWLAIMAAAIAALGISLAQLVTGDALLPRFVVFASALGAIPWQVFVNGLARHEESRDEERDKVLLIAAPAEQERLIDDLRMELERSATLVVSLTPDDAADDAPGTSPILEAQTRTRATVVVVDRSAMADDRVVAQAAALHESGIRVRTLLGFYEEWLGKLPTSELERASLFFDIGEVHRARYSRVKRLMDLSIGIVGLVPLLAMIVAVWLGNIIGNRGPLFYSQVRVGKAGEPFRILKFRTMRVISEDHPTDWVSGRGQWTTEHDPRITPFGGLLRRTHLDELPQVINILKGDLAVVGPRPEQPHYVDELSEKLAFYDLRHLVRPGLTGWAQVKYGYAGDERDALEKLQYEFFYLRHQSLTFDLRIILRTFRSFAGGPGRGR